MDSEIVRCKVGVIGAGLAGLASAVFSINKGFDTVVVGDVSELSFASGCLDLCGANQEAFSGYFKYPWPGVESLVGSNCRHPYSFVSHRLICGAFEEFSLFMESVGLPYFHDIDENQMIITPAGTMKPSWYIPQSMAAGAKAVKEKKKILILEINGLKGFSSDMIRENLQKYGVDVFSDSIAFPGRGRSGEINCEMMARDLEVDDILERFAKNIAEKAGDAEAIGIPAVLGIYKSEQVRIRVNEIVGREVFEIPTFSPSVSGLRLKEKAFDGLGKKGGRLFLKSRVDKIERADEKFVFRFKSGCKAYTVEAENLVLATGRFFGRGLCVEDSRIIEPLAGLKVLQPEDRGDWFESDFFSDNGHAINKAGVFTDSNFRPFGTDGELFHENLYAVGGILSNQDWKREKSGAGISLVTAYSAISSMAMHEYEKAFIESEHKIANMNVSAA